MNVTGRKGMHDAVFPNGASSPASAESDADASVSAEAEVWGSEDGLRALAALREADPKLRGAGITRVDPGVPLANVRVLADVGQGCSHAAVLQAGEGLGTRRL